MFGSDGVGGEPCLALPVVRYIVSFHGLNLHILRTSTIEINQHMTEL